MILSPNQRVLCTLTFTPKLTGAIASVTPVATTSMKQFYDFLTKNLIFDCKIFLVSLVARFLHTRLKIMILLDFFKIWHLSSLALKCAKIFSKPVPWQRKWKIFMQKKDRDHSKNYVDR